MDEIMCRLEADAKGQGSSITMEEIDRIGIALIENHCDRETTASELGMTLVRLNFLIRELDELQVYYEIAQEGIKSLTDRKIIQKLKEGDIDVLKMVFGKMYAGRAKGGFNIAEIGTMGYNDKLAKKLAAETEDDRKSNKVHVEFNFYEKPVRTDFEQIEVDGNVIETEDKGTNEFEKAGE